MVTPDFACPSRFGPGDAAVLAERARRVAAAIGDVPVLSLNAMLTLDSTSFEVTVAVQAGDAHGAERVAHRLGLVARPVERGLVTFTGDCPDVGCVVRVYAAAPRAGTVPAASASSSVVWP